MNKILCLLIIGIFVAGCATPQLNETPQALDLDVRLAGRPALEQPLTLQVGSPGDKVKAEDLQLLLPKGYDLLSERANGEDFIKEFVVKPGQLGLAELMINLNAATPARQVVYVYLARAEGSKMQSPIELSVTIEPMPELGKTLHVQAWATALVDSPNTTLEIRSPAGLPVTAGAAAASRDLAANEALDLSTDLLVEQQGEFPVEIEAMSKTSDDLFWGRKMTFYVQVGTSLGNTITEFSQAAINSSNESQIERGTPLPPPTQPAEPPKKDGWVEPVMISDTGNPGNPPGDVPLPRA